MTVGGMSNTIRTYDDIEAILHRNKVPYKVHEEHKEGGKFKSYTVET